MTPRPFLCAAFVAAWLGAAQPGWPQGTIAYFQPEAPIAMFTRGFPERYALDMDGDANPELTFTYSFQFLGVRSETATRILTWMDPPPNLGGSPSPLALGFLISTGSDSGQLQWFSGVPGADPETDFDALAYCFNVGCGGGFLGQRAYMGVEFQRGGATHYGWVLLDVASDYPAGQIEAWAWDTRPGEAILAGAVPEPSTWALLGTGGLFFWWYGRRKQTG